MTGPGQPLPAASLTKAQERLGIVWPPSYRTMLQEHGLGVLCGRFHLHDPTDLDPNGDWALHARFMRREGRSWHREGAWSAITTEAWPKMTVFADDGRGRLAWDREQCDSMGEWPIWYLDYTGEVALRAGGSIGEVAEALIRGALPGIEPMPATYSTVSCGPSGFIMALERPSPKA
jgi:hypothetical protein